MIVTGSKSGVENYGRGHRYKFPGYQSQHSIFGQNTIIQYHSQSGIVNCVYENFTHCMCLHVLADVTHCTCAHALVPLHNVLACYTIQHIPCVHSAFDGNIAS